MNGFPPHFLIKFNKSLRSFDIEYNRLPGNSLQAVVEQKMQAIDRPEPRILFLSSPPCDPQSPSRPIPIDACLLQAMISHQAYFFQRGSAS